jgi:hypothetical protein
LQKFQFGQSFNYANQEIENSRFSLNLIGGKMKFIKNLTVALCFLMAANLIVFAQNNANLPQITASNIVAEIIKKKKANPKISSRDLAAYANQLLAKKGFNYAFNIADLFDKNIPPRDFKPAETFQFARFPFEFTMGDKSKKTFTLNAKKMLNECFDESYPAFPLIKAVNDEATLIIKSKSHQIKIPTEFNPLEAILVDTRTKKKVLQKWILPSFGLDEGNFIGISADGKKLYLTVQEEFANDTIILEVKELALEIAADGTIKFVPKVEVKKKFKWEFLNDATELNDVLARVTINGKVFLLAIPVTDC